MAQKKLKCLKPVAMDDMGPGGWKSCGRCAECDPVGQGCPRKRKKPHDLIPVRYQLEEDGSLTMHMKCSNCPLAVALRPSVAIVRNRHTHYSEKP